MHQFFKGTLAGAFVGILAASAAAGAAPAPQTSTPQPDRAQQAPTPPPGQAAADDKQTLYVLGVLLSRNLDSFGLSPQEFQTVEHGFSDGFHHLPPTKDAETHIAQVQALQRDRSHKVNDAYLAKAAAKPGAVKTASGLIYTSVREGQGASPQRTDRVKVNYEGRLIDGTVFDSSAQHGGTPASFAVSGIIPCWTEALLMMKVGGKALIVCPAAIAYGERAIPPKIRPGSTLEFDVELLDVEPAPAAAAPSAPPAMPAAGSPPGATDPSAPPAPPPPSAPR